MAGTEGNRRLMAETKGARRLLAGTNETQRLQAVNHDAASGGTRLWSIQMVEGALQLQVEAEGDWQYQNGTKVLVAPRLQAGTEGAQQQQLRTETERSW